MKPKVWLAVDKDGTEKASNGYLARRGTRIFRAFDTPYWLRRITTAYTKNQRNKWADMWSSGEEDPFPFNGVTLPKGTIKKLIGKDLTWTDEPVEYNG